MSFIHDLYSGGGKSAKGGITIIGDKSPYVSPMDKSVVDGRTAHKEHMKRHGVMEAGDMKMGGTQERAPLDGPRTDIQRAMQELRSR